MIPAGNATRPARRPLSDGPHPKDRGRIISIRGAGCTNGRFCDELFVEVEQRNHNGRGEVLTRPPAVAL